MEKQKLLYQQARLHNRGAAEMVLQTISASKGRIHPTHSKLVYTKKKYLNLNLTLQIPFHFHILNRFILKNISIGKQI